MLKQILYSFPTNTTASLDFFLALQKICTELPNAEINNDQIRIQANNPPHAFPQINMAKSLSDMFLIHFYDTTSELTDINKTLDTMFETTKSNQEVTKGISLAAFYEKLKGHITRIDHAGLNIPSKSMSKNLWDGFIKEISRITTIYNYPTGEDWPFILLATEEEFDSDISDFPFGRDPKFEFVYDTSTITPTIQFDIETNLTREKVKKLFPYPIGQSLEGLDPFFRSVYISSPFPNMYVRFDIRYSHNKSWITGKWLVEDGKRIIP